MRGKKRVVRKKSTTVEKIKNTRIFFAVINQNRSGKQGWKNHEKVKMYGKVLGRMGTGRGSKEERSNRSASLEQEGEKTIQRQT